eukprot:Colp12_sorted_trinity150504_noHs@8913
MAAQAQKIVLAVLKVGQSTVGGAVSTAQKGYGAVAPHVGKFWESAKVELAPPSGADIAAAQKSVLKMVADAQKMKFLELTTTEAFKNALVVAEVVGIFSIGEMIGRRHIIGYNHHVEHHAESH